MRLMTKSSLKRTSSIFLFLLFSPPAASSGFHAPHQRSVVQNRPLASPLSDSKKHFFWAPTKKAKVAILRRFESPLIVRTNRLIRSTESCLSLSGHPLQRNFRLQKDRPVGFQCPFKRPRSFRFSIKAYFIFLEKGKETDHFRKTARRLQYFLTERRQSEISFFYQ